MKIRDGSGRSSAVGGASRIPPTTPAAQAAGAPATSVLSDEVQLSNLAQLAAASGDSPSHVTKLSFLITSVSSGGYQVEAGVLSDNIIDANTRLAPAQD